MTCPGPGSGWRSCADCGGPIEYAEEGFWFHTRPEDAATCGTERPQDAVRPEDDDEGVPA